MTNEPTHRTFSGVAVARGIAMGKAVNVDTAHMPAHVPHHTVADGDLSREIARFRNATRSAHKQLDEFVAKVETRVGKREADLIRGQALMIEDPTFIAEVEEIILEEKINAEAAVARVVERFEKLIESLDDPYLRERGSDVRDAGQRILANLLFVDGTPMTQITAPCIVIADNLVPSLTVHLDRENILAFATEKGGYTSHAAILARSLNIPAVTGMEGLADAITDGETVIVDGLRGIVIVGPSEADQKFYAKASLKYESWREKLLADAQRPSVTADGVPIAVMGNAGRPQDVRIAVDHGAERIGLYRTEFDYFDQATLPSEDLLAERYGQAAAIIGERGIVLRVLDIGGDKFPAAIPLAHESNPFLGLRGLRLLLQRAEDLLLPQMRAILRASVRGKTMILYPMVATVADLDSALKLFERAKTELLQRGLPFAENVEQGIMIETPSCIPMLPDMLKRVDFASIGTNDLTQYMLVADRDNERMVSAYDPFNPAIVRTLATIQRVCDEQKKPVSICGEIAADSVMLPLLVGLGYREFSVNVGVIPEVKEVIRSLNAADCAALAERALKAETSSEMQKIVRE